ncbi:MAG: ATP-binding protein [Bacteroidota bacterium]
MRKGVVKILGKLLFFQYLSIGIANPLSASAALLKLDSLQIASNNTVFYHEEALANAIENKDTIGQIEALYNLGGILANDNQYEAAFDYYQRSLVLQRAKRYFEKELSTIRHIAWLYLEKIDLNRGIATFKEGIALAEKRSDWTAMATFYRYLGLGYQKKGLHDKSLEAYQQELYIREHFEKDEGKVLATKARIALLDIAENDLVDALNYSKQGLQMAIEKKDDLAKANFNRMIALVYLQQGHCDTALTYFRQSATTQFRQLNFSDWTTSALQGIERCLEKLDQLDSAIVYINRDFPNAANAKWTFMQARIAATLGKAYLKQSKFQLANEQLEKSVQLAQKGNLPQAELDATWVLYRLFVKQKKYQLALVQLEKHQKLQKLLFDEERIKRVARLRANYDFEKEKQALFLKNEQEKLALDQQIRQQRIWILFITLALSFSLLVGYLIYRFQKLKRENASEQAKLRANLQEQERIRLEEMDAFKTNFFVNISHELRTPLSIIMGMNEKIKEDPARWSLEGTELIHNNAHQLLSLTNQILELHQLDAKTVQLNLVQGDVVPFLSNTFNSFKSLAASKQLELVFTTSSSTIKMDYDAEKLQWIVANLLSNAIKFTPERGKISLSLQKVNNRLSIQVEDTGVGIPADQQAQIFDRYFQVENEATPKGSGIGLSLVKELVNLLEGKIKVESQVGMGSTFIVELPITQNAPLEEKVVYPNGLTSSVSSLQKKSTAKKVAPLITLPQLLIVEDNPDMLQFLIACLSEEYQLITAKNGQAGIEKAMEKVPDIILSDVMMPLKNGYDLCETLKKEELTSHIPIIMLTAKADMESKLSGLDKGADAYLGKPFYEKELKVRLKNLLQLRRQLHKKYATGALLLDKVKTELTVDELFLQKINAFVKAQMTDVNFDLGALCQHLHMSRSQVFRKVKALTGKSPTLYIRSIRLQTAHQLIQSTDLTIAEVAYRVGYSSTSYFSKTYFEEFRVRPSEARG